MLNIYEEEIDKNVCRMQKEARCFKGLRSIQVMECSRRLYRRPGQNKYCGEIFFHCEQYRLNYAHSVVDTTLAEAGALFLITGWYFIRIGNIAEVGRMY
jgi:hypothetical protein